MQQGAVAFAAQYHRHLPVTVPLPGQFPQPGGGGLHLFLAVGGTDQFQLLSRLVIGDRWNGVEPPFQGFQCRGAHPFRLGQHFWGGYRHPQFPGQGPQLVIQGVGQGK